MIGERRHGNRNNHVVQTNLPAHDRYGIAGIPRGDERRPKEGPLRERGRTQSQLGAGSNSPSHGRVCNRRGRNRVERRGRDRRSTDVGPRAVHPVKECTIRSGSWPTVRATTSDIHFAVNENGFHPSAVSLPPLRYEHANLECFLVLTKTIIAKHGD